MLMYKLIYSPFVQFYPLSAAAGILNFLNRQNSIVPISKRNLEETVKGADH